MGLSWKVAHLKAYLGGAEFYEKQFSNFVGLQYDIKSLKTFFENMIKIL